MKFLNHDDAFSLRYRLVDKRRNRSCRSLNSRFSKTCQGLSPAAGHCTMGSSGSTDSSDTGSPCSLDRRRNNAALGHTADAFFTPFYRIAENGKPALPLSRNPLGHIFPGAFHFKIIAVTQGIMLMNQRPERP